MMKRPKVLVVEDDPHLQRLLTIQLTNLKAESGALVTGEEAAAYDFTDVSLVIIDLGLPGIDGVETMQRIRERERKENLRRVPIIATSANPDSQKCVTAGMDDFVQKPILMADLEAILKKWCAEYYVE